MNSEGIKKSKGMGVLIFFLLVVAVVILIVSKSKFTSGEIEVNSSVNTNVLKESREYSLGDIVNIGSYKIQISNSNNEEDMGRNYVVLNLTVENTSNEPIKALGNEKNFLKITDNDGTYGLDFDKTIDLEAPISNKEHSLLSSGMFLNPHTTYTSNIVFENNKPITKGEVSLKVNDREIVYKL